MNSQQWTQEYFTNTPINNMSLQSFISSYPSSTNIVPKHKALKNTFFKKLMELKDKASDNQKQLIEEVINHEKVESRR